MHCFVVTYTRHGDDPFTEPIRAEEWQCTILDKVGSPRPGWIVPGDGYEFHYWRPDQVGVDIPWSGQVENERVEGVGLQPARRPKPPPPPQ